MSFGGPQWPQEPQQQGGQGFGPPPQGQQPGGRYGDPYAGQQPAQPHAGQSAEPYGGPYGQQPAQPFGGGSSSPFGAAASDAHTPDWGALADASAARQRRKRFMLAGGGLLAVAAIGTVVAVAVTAADKGTTAQAPAGSAATAPGGPEIPAGTAGPEPSFSSVAPAPPPDPMDFLTTADKDKAPLAPEDLFPGKKLTVGDRVYRKGAVASTTNCAGAGKDGLGAVLQQHGCTRVIRATYERDGVAVTAGVALFEDEATALKAKQDAKGGIAPLAGDGVDTFCRATVCLRRSNALGRYAYFTQAGFADGRKVTQQDAAVFQTSDDLGTFTFNQIYARGRAQASAAATTPASGGQ
ncbi:hypothetical protein BJP40_30365 [Streptomyces sp. CC53]|uniref:hypothetical protein n=1 Tax=unclassified Streptomyces TaxID=2593676 RepID=UPI0008DE07A7|nr:MULTISPECIES: hypothetical protein [unclassified Streptomyces]OII61722.1 hypothetical protein BJP40_30365 [Streptomyces sp. CC53]